MNKLEKIRNKIEIDKDIYVDEEQQKFCEYIDNIKDTTYNIYKDEKYKEFKKKIILKKKEINFRYLKEIRETDNEADNFKEYLRLHKNKLDFQENNFNYTIIYNNYNKKFINRIQALFDISYIQEYINEQCDFIASLSLREINLLKDYTHKGYKIINKYLNNTFNYLFDFDINYDKNITFFYQFLDYFTENNIFKDKIVSTNNQYYFLDFLRDNKRYFDMDIYNSVFNMYIKELKELFKKAPKTKQRITLYRGVKSNYIENYVSNHKTKGYYKTTNFSSTTLFAEHAILFSGIHNKIYEIIVESNVSIIFLEPITLHNNEFEFLLPINSLFYIDYALKKINYYYSKEYTICKNQSNSIINVTTINLY